MCILQLPGSWFLIWVCITLKGSLAFWEKQIWLINSISNVTDKWMNTNEQISLMEDSDLAYRNYEQPTGHNK